MPTEKKKVKVKVEKTDEQQKLDQLFEDREELESAVEIYKDQYFELLKKEVELSEKKKEDKKLSEKIDKMQKQIFKMLEKLNT